MITNLNEAYDVGNEYLRAEKLVGLSSDEKPIYVGNGTTLLCMDTNTTYIYDAENSFWHEYKDASGSSDAPGTCSCVLVCNALPNGSLDRTWQEIADAPWPVLTFQSSDGKGFAYPTEIGVDGNEYYVYFLDPISGSAMKFDTDSVEGFPAMNQPTSGGSDGGMA